MALTGEKRPSERVSKFHPKNGGTRYVQYKYSRYKMQIFNTQYAVWSVEYRTKHKSHARTDGK
jgi:hypothetical protein